MSCSLVDVAALVVDIAVVCAMLVVLVMTRLVLSACLGCGAMCTVDAPFAVFALSPPCDRQLFAVRALPEKSFLSPRWLTPVSCRGFGDGDARSLTPGCSVTRIGLHCDVKWTNTCHQHRVRTTTTTTRRFTPELPVLCRPFVKTQLLK